MHGHHATQTRFVFSQQGTQTKAIELRSKVGASQEGHQSTYDVGYLRGSNRHNPITLVFNMPVFALLIISKAGSLIYHRTFPTSTPSNSNNASSTQPTTGTLGLPGTTTLTTNDYLVLAGTFHGVHAITRSLTPRVSLPSNSSSSSTPRDSSSYSYPDPTVPASGIESLESSFFRLTVFQTATGTKFLLFTDPSMPNTDVIMKGVYDRFADYVCKNPFWQMEMPIRIEIWDREVGKWLTRR